MERSRNRPIKRNYWVNALIIFEVYDFIILTLFNYLFRNSLQIDQESLQPVWHPIIDFEHLMKSEPSKLFGGSGKGYIGYKSDRMRYYEALNMKFSCLFDFHLFPFDSHTCCIEYGDLHGSDNVILSRAIVIYGSKTTRDGSFELKFLPFPFQIEIESLTTSGKNYSDHGKTRSYTGMCFKMNRKTRGHLISGFYYPTASFGILSLISYLIKPDMVRIYS